MSSVGARELDFDRYSETGWVRILGDAGGFDAPTGAGGACAVVTLSHHLGRTAGFGLNLAHRIAATLS